MSRTSACASFSIGNDHLAMMDGDQPVTIYDSSVVGVSTRVIRDGTWYENRLRYRVVDIEYLDDNGQTRLLMIEHPVASKGDDTLAQYARRIAKSAAENAINELVANERVERKGFMISDQGVMLTGSGTSLCCGLFDLEAVDVAGDRTVLWMRGNSLPAVVLRMDDPNALTLSNLLPKLIREEDAGSQQLRHAIGEISADRHGGGPMRLIQGLIALVTMVVGLVPMALIGGVFNLFAIIPVAAILGAFAYYQVRRAPSMMVFRRGLFIERSKQGCELNWDDFKMIEVTDREINLGDAQHSHYVTLYTLRLKTTHPQFFGSDLKIEWTESEETQTAKEFLARIAADRKLQRAVDAVRKRTANPVPELAAV